MGAPIQGQSDKRGNANNNNSADKNGFGKPRQFFHRRPLNGNNVPPMMRSRVPFPPNRGGPMGMRPVSPLNMRPPPPRGLRPLRMPRGPLMPPRMMGLGPRIPPPPLGVRLPPPPHVMGMPPGPPPGMGGMGFRRSVPINRSRKFPFGMFKGVQKGRVMKKCKPMIKDLDLTKEWVTDAIKEEFKKKDELLVAAKSAGPDSKEAWSHYRTQREKCSQMYCAAEMEFIGQQENSEKEQEYEDSEDPLESEEILFCDVCEQDFYSQHLYQKHLSEHKVCGLDGCQYTAHADLIEKHIEIQHVTGLYEKIRSVSTPAEIAKWIDERRVRYPTRENIQHRYEKQQEMLKRGEKIGLRKNRFGRDKTRQSHKQKRPAKKRKMKVATTRREPKKSIIDEKCDWNGTMFPFRGTNALYIQKIEETTSDFDDEEWLTEVSNTNVSVKLNNALGDLMGAYMSDDEDTLVENETNDEEAPTEEKIEKHSVEYPNEEPEARSINRSKNRRIFNRTTRKKQLKLCDKNTLRTGIGSIKFFKRTVTLLERLLDGEIRHERNILLQCVQFVVSNSFFKTSDI